MKQETLKIIADIHYMARKIINSPAQYVELEDELFKANKSLSDAWQSVRAMQRMQDLNKVADLKVAGL